MVIPFLTLYLTIELDFSLTQAGMTMAFYGVGSVVGAYIGGWLTDRVGYYPTMFWSLVIGGISLFSLLYAKSYIEFSVAVFVVSLIVDSFRPASMASIGSYSKPENHNRSVSLIRLAINLGFAGGAAATGFIVALFGYNWLFIIDGTTCIVAAFLLLALLKEKKVEKVEEEEEKDEAVTVTSTSVYSDTNFLLFITAKCLGAIAFFQLFFTFPLYVKTELGFSEDQYGWLMLANGLIIAMLEMPAVYILEQHFKRMPLVIAGYFLFALAYFALLIPGLWVVGLIVFILAISIGEIIGFPFSNAFALSRSSEDRRGEYMGMYSMAFSIAFILASTLGTRIAENLGFTMLWILSGGICMVSVLGFFIMNSRLKKEEVARVEEVSEMVV